MALNVRRVVHHIAPALLLAALCTGAYAQSYPSADIHFVTGFPPGSGADVITRFFAEKLRPVAGRTILVENKVGAAGAIAIEYAAKLEAGRLHDPVQCRQRHRGEHAPDEEPAGRRAQGV